MSRLAIIGRGDLGMQIANIAGPSGFKVVGYFDDTLKGSEVLGGTHQVFESYKKDQFDFLAIGIGYDHMDFRKEIFQRFVNQIPFAIICHPTAYIDKTVELGEGCVIFPHVVLDYGVILKPNVLVNLGGSISHHSQVAAHCFLSPRVAIAGFCQIGESCVLGINSTIIDNVSIVANCRFGSASNVISDICDLGLYVGNPTRLVR